MRRHVVIIIIGIFCVVIAFIAFINIAFSYPWIIYPTKSSPNKLSLVCHSGFWPNKPVITLKNYVNGMNIGNYTLEIRHGVQIQEPQSYELPKIDNGMVEVNVDLGDKENSKFTLTFHNAKDFYQKGMLIYLADYDDNDNLYVYIVSGKETTCYNRAKDSGKWIIKTEVPSPKAFPHKNYFAYVSIYSGWKENKWVSE